MRIVICEDESYYQEAICDVIKGWMMTTNRQDVSYVCFHYAALDCGAMGKWAGYGLLFFRHSNSR